MIRLVLADDEAPARHRLRTLLADHPDLEIAGEAENGDSALAQIMSLKPDGVILDITMPGVSVFSTLAGLKDPPAVIFLTAHAEFAVDAFSLKAVDYLLKPVGRERFAEAMERLRQAVSPAKAVQGTTAESGAGSPEALRLTVKAGSVIRIVDPESVRCVVFREGFSFLGTDEGELCSDDPLNHFEELLEPKGFVRISRQALVNTRRVARIHSRTGDALVVELKSGERLPVSRRRAAELRQLFGF